MIDERELSPASLEELSEQIGKLPLMPYEDKEVRVSGVLFKEMLLELKSINSKLDVLINKNKGSKPANE